MFSMIIQPVHICISVSLPLLANFFLKAFKSSVMYTVLLMSKLCTCTFYDYRTLYRAQSITYKPW